MLGRIPFIFPADKLREQILKLYEIGNLGTSDLMGNTLKILSHSTLTKTTGNYTNNLFFLINRIFKYQKTELVESTKRYIISLKDYEIIQIVMNLVKILPSNEIFHTISAVLTQCAAQLKYSLLTELIKDYSIIKTLFGYLKFAEVHCNVIALLQFFLLGYHDSLSIFHEYIPEFEKYLIKTIKTDFNSITFPKMLVELLILLMKRFPGYPEQYGRLVELIKEVILKYHLSIMIEDKFEQIIQASNWSNITRKPLAPKNPFGYKGLANLGNSNFVIKLSSLLHELHTPSSLLLNKIPT